MTNYQRLCEQLRALAETERHYLPLLSNASALLMAAMADLNWAGFYLMRGGQLVLGPFQGKVACIHIAVGKGVCGAAVAQRASCLVEDVHSFPGHIACDSASNAELVVPIFDGERVVGVLDLDSPSVGRFTAEDKAGLEDFVRTLESLMDMASLERFCLSTADSSVKDITEDTAVSTGKNMAEYIAGNTGKNMAEDTSHNMTKSMDSRAGESTVKEGL